jgi:hypothetical protein
LKLRKYLNENISKRTPKESSINIGILLFGDIDILALGAENLQ